MQVITNVESVRHDVVGMPSHTIGYIVADDVTDVDAEEMAIDTVNIAASNDAEAWDHNLAVALEQCGWRLAGDIHADGAWVSARVEKSRPFRPLDEIREIAVSEVHHAETMLTAAPYDVDREAGPHALFGAKISKLTAYHLSAATRLVEVAPWLDLLESLDETTSQTEAMAVVEVHDERAALVESGADSMRAAAARRFRELLRM